MIMKTSVLLFTLISFTGIFSLQAQESNEAATILEKVDKNLPAQNRIFESSMTIHGRRTSRTITSKSRTRGEKEALTEYLSPASEAGTKMLKLENQLWIYTPSADRTIQISGHMLRQSVMGSDLSYEDMMDDRKLTEVYSAEVIARDTLRGERVVLLQLTARSSDVAYPVQKMWIDAEKFVPLRQEMYARSGQLLKRVDLFDVRRIQNRWFPMRMVYRDMLKTGGGTEFTVTSIAFDTLIPEHIFSKASLR